MQLLTRRLIGRGIEVRDRRNWKRVSRKTDQDRPHLIFDPFNEFDLNGDRRAKARCPECGGPVVDYQQPHRWAGLPHGKLCDGRPVSGPPAPDANGCNGEEP